MGTSAVCGAWSVTTGWCTRPVDRLERADTERVEVVIQPAKPLHAETASPSCLSEPADTAAGQRCVRRITAINPEHYGGSDVRLCHDRRR